ncbi:MAG: PIN domain-containing protein [Bacillota bacterium]|nr:PIN domain-containing protein [Bacillota bacterium]
MDTSTWVLALRKDGSPDAAAWLSTALEAEKVVMVPLVKVELLLGARDEAHYATLKEELDALPQLPTAERVYEEAANLAFNLRRKGRTLPLIDVFIAAFAIIHSCTLVHHDRHYELVREALPACSLETLVMPPFVE